MHCLAAMVRVLHAGCISFVNLTSTASSSRAEHSDPNSQSNPSLAEVAGLCSPIPISLITANDQGGVSSIFTDLHKTELDLSLIFKLISSCRSPHRPKRIVASHKLPNQFGMAAL